MPARHAATIRGAPAPIEGAEASARTLLDALVADRDRYAGLGRTDAITSLQRNFDAYVAHHRVPGMPADANITENVIKQLAKKLRLMEGSAEHFSRLLVACYRFKRFTDSCRTKDNGRSPLELAGVKLGGLDWLSYPLAFPTSPPRSAEPPTTGGAAP